MLKSLGFQKSEFLVTCIEFAKADLYPERRKTGRHRWEGRLKIYSKYLVLRGTNPEACELNGAWLFSPNSSGTLRNGLA